MSAPRKVGVGLRDQRARMLRSLDAHLRWLRVAETLGPWTPPVRAPYAERPRYAPRYKGLPAYVYPVERPALARRVPRPEDLSTAEVQTWVNEDAFVRSGLQEATQRALAYIATFAPAKGAPRGTPALVGALLGLLLTSGGASAQGYHVGDPQLGRQVPGPLSVTYDAPVDTVPSNALVVQCKSGVLALATTQTIGTDQVGISSWCYRGAGAWSAMYGANFGVVFTTPGQVRGLELDVNNYGADAGPAAYGEHVGLWINRSGPYHNSSAIEVSTQDAQGWHYGIHFDAGPVAGVPSLGAGIRFDRSNASHFLVMQPVDDVDADAVLLTDAGGAQTKAVIRKRGAFGGQAFYFVADPGTEVYQPAPGQLGVRLGGVERFKITDTALVFDGRAGLTTCVGGVLTFTAGLLTDTGGCAP